jgi:transposase
MDPFAIVPAHPNRPGKTSYPLLTRCFRCHLLRAKKRLPLAAFAPRLPSLVYRLLPWHLILKVLCAAERKRAGKDPQPTAAIMDSQSVKTTEESAHPCGYDARKNVKGRKRHLLVDTLGLLLSVYVSPADVQHRGGAQGLLAGLEALLPRLKKIWAAGAYTGETLAGWCKEQGEWELEIVERSSRADTEGFIVLPHRWIVERTFGWLTRNRRLSKDYKRLVQTSETFIEVAMIRLILRRLAKGA